MPLSRLRPSLLSTLGILLIFIFGLSIPKISDLAIFGLCLVGTWQMSEQQRLLPSDVFTTLLLAVFLLVYFAISAYYGFSDAFPNFKDGVVILLSYGAGLTWGRLRNGGASSAWMPAAMAAGFTLYSFLTAFTNPSNVETFLSTDRSAPSFWSGGPPLNGPVLGIYASLGLCLLPLVLLRSDGRRGGRVFALPGVILLFAGFGFTSNLILQNRSPYFALAASFLFCSAIYFQRAEGGLPRRSAGLLLRLSPLLVVVLILMIQFPDFFTQILFRRFSEQGVDTGGRTTAWISVLQDLPIRPFGGKVISLGDVNYAHNLWLDVAYTSGLIALLALLAFHLGHVPYLWRFYRSRQPATETMMVSALGISLLVGCLGEPIIDASILYFGATCFLLGWVKARTVRSGPTAAHQLHHQ